MRLGIISDTHGLLRPEAVTLLKTSDLIIHAGDIGSKELLGELKQLASVIAVRGNVDIGNWALDVPEYVSFTVEGSRIFVTHKEADLQHQASASTANIIIFGHSHKPTFISEGGQIRLNPGSAGRQRFRLPVSLVIADLSSALFKPTFFNLLTCQSLVVPK